MCDIIGGMIQAGIGSSVVRDKIMERLDYYIPECGKKSALNILEQELAFIDTMIIIYQEYKRREMMRENNEKIVGDGS